MPTFKKGICITDAVMSMNLSDLEKGDLLCDHYFVNWLCSITHELITELQKPIASKTTSIGFQVIKVTFETLDENLVGNFINTSSFLNSLIFHNTRDLLDDHLRNYNKFK